MKKLTALLLALAMVFMLMACSNPSAKDPCTEHIDEDTNFKCDVCGEDLTPPVAPGLSLANALATQIENAKSMKLELEINAISTDTIWELEDNSDSLEINSKSNSAPVEKTYYDDMLVKVSMVLSKNDDNTISAKIDAKSFSREDVSQEYETVGETETVYILSGIVYSYDSNLEAYVKSSDNDSAEAAALFEKLLDGTDFSEHKNDENLTKIGDYIIKTFSIKDYKGSISVDLKPMADDLLAYIDALDLEKDQLKKVVNDALALINTELTVEKLLTEAERVSGLTVNAAIAEIDAWLTKDYNTTLQGIYDKLIADENVITVIENALNMSYTHNADGTISEEAKAQIDATLAEIKGFKLADAITEAEIGDVTLYDLVAMMYPDIPDKDALFTSIEEMLNMTLADFEEAMDVEVFTEAKVIAAGITVNALNAKLDVNFKDILAINTVEGTANVDIEVLHPSQFEGKNNKTHAKATVKFKLSDISTAKVDIKLPEGAKVFNIDLNTYFTPVENASYTVSYYPIAYGHAYFNFYLDDGNVMTVSADDFDAVVIDDHTLAIPSEYATVNYNGYEITLEEGERFVITFNMENYTYELLEIPSFEEIEIGDGVTLPEIKISQEMNTEE